MMVETDIDQPYIVLVTGGSGTLGRHVVGLLQTRASHVTAIRVLDLQPFQNSKAYVSCKPVREYIGDICDVELMKEACKDVTSVIHLATSQDLSPVPDVEKSYRRNIQGTETLIKTCRETGVKHIVFYSSIAAVYGFDEVINGIEGDMNYPTQFYFSADGNTLSTAEQLVINSNDSDLRTICLRPVMPYGEDDDRFLGNRVLVDYYVPDYQCLDMKDWAYNGNIAWAFVSAESSLHENSNDVTGSTLFIGDDTPTQTSEDTSFLESIFEECGLKPLPVIVYRVLLAICMHILFMILQFMSLFGYTRHRVDIWRFWWIKKKMLVRHDAAKRIIGYNPIYTVEESTRKTKAYVEWKRTLTPLTPKCGQNFMKVLEPLKYLYVRKNF